MTKPEQDEQRLEPVYVDDGKGGYTYRYDDDGSKPFVADAMADVPFEPIRDHWRSLPTWPPHMAAAWAAEPTWEEVVAQARRQTGGPGMREASEAVLAALKDGRLTAYGMREDGRMGRKAPERITPDEWRDLIWIGGTLSTAALNKHTGEEKFRDVQIDCVELFAVWPDPETKVEKTFDALTPSLAAEPERTDIADFNSVGRPSDLLNYIASQMLEYIKKHGSAALIQEKQNALTGLFLGRGGEPAARGTCVKARERALEMHRNEGGVSDNF